MTFRISGTAWDGQKWLLAPALVTYAGQIEAIRPGTYPLDGTVASEGHDENNPDSDHTVWPKSGAGVVYAIDIAEAGGLSIDALFEAERKARDPRGKYWIHHSRMFSSYAVPGYPAWTWRPYSGYNAHKGHGHKSVYHESKYANDPRKWDLGGTVIVDPPAMIGDTLFCQYGHGYKSPPADSGLVGNQEAFKQNVIYNQNLLNRCGAGLVIDGVYGGDTVAAVIKYGASKDGRAITGWVLDNIQAQAFKTTSTGVTIGEVNAAITKHASNPDAHHD